MYSVSVCLCVYAAVRTCDCVRVFDSASVFLACVCVYIYICVIAVAGAVLGFLPARCLHRLSFMKMIACDQIHSPPPSSEQYDYKKLANVKTGGPDTIVLFLLVSLETKVHEVS